MSALQVIQKKEDVPKDFQGTPVSDLLLYHNSKMPHKSYQKAELLIGMCMDNRKTLNIPENFAFVLRTGGANLRYNEFKVSYAIAIGGIRHIALIGHTQCGMSNLNAKKDQFIQGLVEGAGWDPKQVEEHFTKFAPMFEIGDEASFILNEAKRLRLKYPKISIAPLLYRVEDNLLYWIVEKESKS